MNEQHKKIESANPTKPKQEPLVYSKAYYMTFFTIMLSSFFGILWLCNTPKLKELFQIIAIAALSIAIAEYFTRRYLKDIVDKFKSFL